MAELLSGIDRNLAQMNNFEFLFSKFNSASVSEMASMQRESQSLKDDNRTHTYCVDFLLHCTRYRTLITMNLTMGIVV